MTINAIGSSNISSPPQAIQRPPESAEVGPDNDGDADDRGSAQAATQAAPAASVNLNGQKLGQVVNAAA